jgi:hypothetical protein
MTQARSYRYAAPTDQPQPDAGEGQPTGFLRFIALPTPTYDALAAKAAERGMTVAQAVARAIDDFFKKPKE